MVHRFFLFLLEPDNICSILTGWDEIIGRECKSHYSPTRANPGLWQWCDVGNETRKKKIDRVGR